ncbi:Hsp20/alpha crystallin family protein [Variovorax sp. HJSM1_2]|uniref:Hsp20/alpha crystallin family protein n=1 Tax=Variovorax sp. HJSM1_2 TaxID=3366263 RepID=UPI003BD96FE4
MFLASASPAAFRRSAHLNALRSLDRFLDQSLSPQKATSVSQDEQAYTLSFDVPGIAKDQLTIGIEGSIVRIETKADAPRQYKVAYELPLDIDTATSEAKLEHGVLTLKLGKKVPVSNVSTLSIN